MPDAQNKNQKAGGKYHESLVSTNVYKPGQLARVIPHLHAFRGQIGVELFLCLTQTAMRNESSSLPAGV